MSADDELRILKPLAPYVEAIVGGKLILEVEISGSPSVCWLRDGFPVLRDNTHDFTHISNQSFSLQIDPVMLTDDGEYECNAQTSTGTTSCYAEVQVRLDDDVEFSQPLLPEEDRQSGLFILFDEGSQDEDEAEEEEDDDTIQSEGNDSRRKSMSASQQMEDILGDLALIEGTTGEKIDEEVESHRFSDAEEAKKQPVQVKKNVKKMASGHARLPAGDDSIPESPIPLQRDLSRGSSIATDASLRIMEVTSPTEGLFSDRAPLVREDSMESKGRLSETIDGVFITELEDDTIIEEQDEEVDDFYSDGADGNREKETDVVAEGTSKESSAYLPDDPDGDNKVREIIDETKTEDSAKNTYSSQYSKLSSEYEKMTRSNEVKTTRSDVQEIERKLEEKEDRQDFSLFKFDSMSSRQREITENKDEWNIGNITDSKKIIDDIFSSKDFEEPSSKIQKQRPEDDAWDFKKFSSVSSDYKKSSEETSSDVKTVHKTDYCDFKSATKYGNTESAHKLDTDERDILDYGENLKKASKYLKDCGETTDRYQKVLEDNELFSSSKRSPEVGKEFDSMKNWNSINTTSQTRHHEDIESTTELSNTFEDKKEEEEEEMKIKWGGKLTEENEHESKKARKRSIEIDEDFGSPKNKDSGRSTSQSQYRDDVVHKEKIFIDPKLAKKLSEVNGQENKHLVEIDENSSKNWDSGRSTSHSRYREELENSSKFSKKYDFKSAVGYEYSNEQYELGSDLLQSPAKSATNTRETSSGRHVGSLFDKASTVVREVEDIFERSKRELEGILDIATSKEIFNNKVRTKSDEDIFQSVEKELEDAFDAGLSVFGDVSGYRKRKLLGPRGPAGDLFELRRQSAPDDAKHDVGDLFDVRKSRKVEDIFEKTKQEMDEFFEDANEVLEEIHQPSSTFTGDDGFFSGSSIRTEIKSEQIGGRDISNLSSVGNADDFFKRESLDDRKSFQEDRNIKDMKRRWRKEVRADGEDIAKDMGISWPPSEGGHWMESSDDSSTSFGETRFKLKERGQQRDQLAVAEFTKDNSEQIDDDTSKLDEDSINDDESIFEDAEGKAQEEIFPLDSTPVKMSVTRSYESHAYTKSADYFEQSFEYKHSSTGGVGSTIKSQTRVSNFESFDTDDSKSEPVFDLYVAIADYIPNGSDDELIPLWEGQIVEVLDSHSSQKWLVRTRPTKTSPSKQGWVPPSYLERKTMSSTLRSIQEILEMEADSKTDSVEREAHKKRTQVVKELIETEDEFVRDMNHVVKTYLRDLDNPRVPMEIRDLRDVIFVNFEQISDFHNSVLAKGIQYYASEPARLGRTFLRLERDFDMHVNYCRDIQQAQSVLTVSPAKEYFEQYSQRIGEVDKTLQDHLKLPIQRINDYQILLKELIKFTARLKEDCTDLERALDLMLSIPQRAQDLEFINSIQGYRGNLLKLGRLLRHDWFTVTDKDGRAKERYLFLFKARILITKVKRISEDRSIFILQEVIKLPEVEVKDVLGDKCRFELHRKIGSGPHQNYPLSLTAKTEFVREAWLKEIKEYANEFVDLGEEEIKVEPEAQSETASTPIKLVEPCEELTTALTDSVQSESAASVKMDGLLEEPKVDSRPTTPGGTILPHAPHFTMKFKDTELIEEGSVTFMVKVRSLPEAEVKFFKDGKPLVENDHVKLVVEDRETFELQISHVKAEDAGKYSCVAKNSEGEETSEAEITVSDHKKVFMGMERSTPVENNVHPGDDVDFKWYRDGQEFEASERFKVMFKDEEDTLALVFQHVKPEDAGLYTCVASTCSGNIACSAELTVQGAVNQLMREPEAPKITVELTDTEVSTGGSAMLEVRVTGFPKPTVKWLKDGKEEVKAGGRFRYLHEDDESVALIIKNVTKEDSGKYKVIATNNLGEASTIGELIVKAPPKFNCQMKDISVMMDELVRFEVEIEGKPTPDITWYKDGRPVIATGRIQTVHETEETFALIIKKVQPDDAGSYSCQAENSSGKISEFSKLTVNSPPTFLKEIKRIECKETETIKFEAKVTGVPMPKVSWSMNGSEIKIDGKHFRVEEDEKNFTLTVDSVTRKDAGNFTCTLTNEHGSTSSSADLVVNCSPEFSQKLSDKTVKEGETNVTFDVKLSGTPEPKIRWFIDGMEIDEKKNNFKVEKDGDKHTLVIKKVTPDVSGKYTIKASNVGGEVNSSASLTVLYKPTFTEELKDREVTEGESVTYVVKVKGTPEPQIKWYKGNEDITVNAKIKFTHESTETWTMTLDCVAASAAGDYECRAHNSEGDASSKSKLTVNTKPTFDQGLSDLDAWLGLQAILEVKVSAIPEAEVKWLKDGKPITASDRVKIEKVGNAYRLIIVETKKEDSGAYKCVVKNKIAEVSSEAKLLVKTPEDAKSPVFTHPIQNKSCIKGENATFEVTILGNPAPLVKWTKNGVELSEGDKYHLGQVAQDYLYRLTVEKCEEGDTAKYAVTAANEHGESKSEAELSVKVPPEITPPSDVFVLPKGSSKCEAKVTGIPQPKVSWLKNGKPLAEGTKFATTADDSKGLYTLSMNGVDLDDGGDYEVVAENAAGKLAKSFKLHFNTNEPKFTKTFSPVSIKPTTSVQLDVEVDGIPMPTVAWLFEGAALTASDRIIIKSSSERSHSLKIEQFAKEDAGLYQCKATSAVGTATCEGKVSVKHEKPSFSKNLPKETCAMDAETFTLEAKVDGSPQPTVKWLKDGKEIVPGDRIKMEVFPDGTVKLTVENAKPSDCGKYTVVATNETGELSSSGTVSVEAVPKPPVIVGELKKTNVVEGSPIQLSAKVTGHPKPKIKWFKDGKPVKPSVRTVEQPDGTVALIIDNAQPEDAGKYSIQVSNPLGEASSEAEVTVQAAQKAPEFGVTLKPCEAYEGFPIKLEGVVKGYPLPEIKWMKDGKEVVPDGQRVVAKMNPDGSFALLINESKPEDAGKYSCVAKNPEGTAESSADVTVNPRTKPGEPTCEPTFLTPLKDVAIDEGTPLKLQAHISSNPLPDMKWTKDGEVISPSDPRVLAQFDGDRVSLEIKKATPSDVGHYECTLTNPQGSNASACDVQVKKLSKAPIFTQRFPDLDSILGQDARFMCRVSGLPFPDISWYFNDRPISSSDKYKTKHEGDMYVLYIKNCTLDDIGNVSCVAKNSDGEDKCTAFHNVASKLDKKQKTEGPSFLKRLADCEVIEGMPGKFTACMSGYPEPQFKWYKDGRELFPSDRYRFEVEPHGLLRLIIKDIKREDMGRYMLKITNPHGEAESEGSLRCEGLEERVPKKPMLDLNIDYEKVRKSGIPFALPDKPIISKMTDRRLTLSWKPSIPIGPRVPVTYIVEMCEVTPDSEWLSIRNGIRGCCCEIKNLEPYRDYKYRIRVENKYGISDPSPYATAYRTKLEMTPPRFLPHLPPEFDFRPETSPYFPKDFDIDRPPHEAYAHAPRFMRQENDAQYGIRNQPSSIHWYVYGYPTPTITWYFNDERIDIVNRYESTFSRNGQVSLFINRFLERDIGIYECVAVNEHGESRQRVRMEISDPPVFSQHLDETTIMIRESGTLQCRCIGTPYPDIKWYKDWHPIVSSNRIKIEWKEPDICSLTITDAISKDGGLYSVGACNVAGMTSNSAMLTIEENELDYSILTYNRSRVVKSRRNKLFEDFYDIGDELGRGTQGIIYHTVERSTGNSYAARIMHGKGDFRDSMNYELDIMNQLHDRYLIRGIDAFDTKRGLTLITELASGGMLLDSLCKQSTLSESEIAYYMRQVLWGLEHMHGKGIAHLGLTAADILLARPGGDDIKICDFGLSRRLVRGQDYFLDYGMPEYVAPEIANKQSVSFYTDMWSVGVITYIFLSGISPFLGANDRETLQQVQQGRINFDADLFSHVSDEGKDFMLKLLMFDPNGRMDVKTALRHPWLKIADRTGTGVGYSTDRLINYHRRYRDWMTNSACRRFYRRRPLSSAYSHPSKMVYPPDEDYTPPSSPETEPSKAALWDKPSFRDKIDTDHEGLEYELGYVDSESKYQNGPDTYLLQLRDVGLPLRLREYMRVAGHSSPSLGLRMIDTMLGKTVTIHERRRFTDVMDEEIGDERKGCNDSVRKRITSEVSPRSETKNRLRELLPQRDDGLYPFFREKTSDIAYVEGEDVELSCYAVGDPKPTVQWYRNDVMLSETHRLKFIETEDGRSVLKFTPIKAFDAGVFKAIARNSSGDAACRARLRLGDISGRADAPEVSQVSGTQALVTWVPPKETGNAAVTGYDLEFKGMDSGDWQTVCQNIDHEFFVVGGLQPRSQYHFRVRATNKFGRGEFSIPSAMAVTGDETTEALTISRAMKHQQDLTISRQTETVDTAQPQTSPLNYEIEESPVEISTQNPSDKYNFIAEIARGRFSVVIKCCDKSTSQFFAAKIIDGSQSNEESAKRESEMICSLCHERLPVISDAYSFSNSYILVMEKLHGYDVLTYLTSRHQYNEETVTKIISQVLDALQYLHFRKILHLDIQPDNVVMTNLQLARVKLVDFGSSRRLTRPGGSVLVEDAGNLEYRAPEIIGNEDVTAQADVWSVGVLTYVILSGASPYVGADEAETKSNITFVRYQFENLFKEITPESTRFMMQIFKKTPFKRLTVDECLEHKWLNPSELMLRKRERAVFLSSRLQNYADEYHRQRSEAATATGKASQLMNSFGQGVSRSISTDCEEKTAV